jgi:hypothetical protein
MPRKPDPRQTDLFAILNVAPALAPPPLFTREAFAAAALPEGEKPLPAFAVERGAALHLIHSSDGRDYWRTRAHQWGGEILAYEGRPAPLELTVRGIRTVVSFGMGFATHAVDPPGSPYWSETGFRSFTCCPQEDPEAISAIIESYIDGPTKHGNGLAGKLSPWWTNEVRQLQQHRGFMSRCERVTPEMHEQDCELAEQVRRQSFDPEAVAPMPKRAKRAA